MNFIWDVDPVIVHFWGNFGIRYYGLIFSLVFIGGFFLFRWQVLRAGGTEDDVYDIVLPGALGTVIGARVGHVLFYNFEYFIRHPLEIVKIWQGGLASHGALIGLLLAIGYYAWRKRQSYLECLDRFSFSAALGATLVRIGNFFNSEIVGKLTDQSWGVRFPRFDGYPAAAAPLRHPSQLYEALLGIIVLAALYLVDRAFGREKRPRGILSAIFLMVYFAGRFTVEFFKQRHILPESSPLSMGQYLSIIPFLAGLILMIYALRSGRPAHWEAPGPAAAAVKQTAAPVRTAGKKNTGKNRKKK